MAFNPFESFRKRGKAIFAVLGIVLMLTFVLSIGTSNNGDLITQLQADLSGGPRNETLGTLYGSKVREEDLSNLVKLRGAVNQFILRAKDRGADRATSRLLAEVNTGKLKELTRSTIREYLEIRGARNGSQADRFKFMRFMLPEQFDMAKGPNARSTIFAVNSARQGLDKESLEGADGKALETAERLLGFDFMLMNGQAGEAFQFPELGPMESGIDFVMFRRRAERMGITYSDEAISELLKAEVHFPIEKETLDEIFAQVQRETNIRSSSAIREHMRTEFQVRSTLLSLDASSAGRGLRGQVNVTPAEFYGLYRDQCSEHSFVMLGLDVDSYLAKVAGQPTDKERSDLFTKYRSVEPDPTKATPGFKEPRKVRPEFVAVSMANPKYVSARETYLKVEPLAHFLATGLAPPSAPGAFVMAAVPYIHNDLAIRDGYGRKLEEFHQTRGLGSIFGLNPTDDTLYSPAAIAALVFGANQTDLATLSIAGGLHLSVVNRLELRNWAPVYAQSYLAPFSPFATLVAPATAAALESGRKPLPLAAYQPQLQSALKKESLRRLFQGDVQRLQSKLMELATDANATKGTSKADKEKIEKSKTAARTHLDEWLRARGLTSVRAKQPVDRFTIMNDPDFKLLNDLSPPDLKADFNGFSDHYFKGFDFPGNDRFPARSFPAKSSVYDPEYFDGSQGISNDSEKPRYLVWSTDEIPASSYLHFRNAKELTNGEIIKRIDDAWRLGKARELAKADAEKYAAEAAKIAKGLASNPDGMRKSLYDFAAQNKLNGFSIERLAMLKFGHGTGQGARVGYQPPTISERVIRRPTPTFAQDMLELRKEPIGSTKVLPDAPQNTYYIAVYHEKSEKTAEDFRKVFAATGPDSSSRDPFFSEHANRSVIIQTQKDFLARLRADADWKESEAYKKRIEKGDKGGEADE